MNLMREEGWGLSNRPSVCPLNVYKSLGLNLIDAQRQSTEFSLLTHRLLPSMQGFSTESAHGLRGQFCSHNLRLGAGLLLRLVSRGRGQPRRPAAPRTAHQEGFPAPNAGRAQPAPRNRQPARCPVFRLACPTTSSPPCHADAFTYPHGKTILTPVHAGARRLSASSSGPAESPDHSSPCCWHKRAVQTWTRFFISL